MSKPKITTTSIKRIFQSCLFSPRKPGPMRIIMDVGDPLYYQNRVCEILKTNTGDTQMLRQAISLLALAIVEIEEKEEPRCRNWEN